MACCRRPEGTEEDTLDPVLNITLRAALGLLLLVAAGHKLAAQGSFRAALAGYRLLPARWVAPVAAALAALELALGLSLGAGVGGASAPLAAAGLLSLYSAAIAVNLARGRRHIDCGCLGAAARQPLSGWLLARNGAVVVAALVCLLPGQPRALHWVDGVSIAGGVLVLAALWAALDLLIASAPALARLRSHA